MPKVFPKPPLYQAAFTLLELIIVVAILAILSAYIATQPDSSRDYDQKAVAEQITAAGRLTQQLSMSDSARTFVLEITANQISITANGAPFSAGNIDYPITIDPQLTLSPATISFDQLGQTTAATISVTGNTVTQVCFESSGLIRVC